MKELFARLRRARGFAEVSVPLSDLLKKGKSEQVQWNETQERAYSLLKEYLLQEPVLKLPELNKPFLLRTDTSGVGVAAVLLQENEGKLYPVGYASKKLTLAEAKYPIIEKGCLAVMRGIRRFKLYLAGKRFTLQTDHKPLKYLKDAVYQNDCVFRWAMAVQEYSFRVEDIPVRRTLGHISGAGLDILVNGQTFIHKYLYFYFLWTNVILIMMFCL